MLNLLQANLPKLEALLTPALLHELRGLGRRRKYADGELIFQRGEKSAGFTLVVSGQVIAGSEGVDGSYLTAALMHAGDHFGEHTLFAGLPRLQSLRANGPTELLHIEAKPFKALFERTPDLARALLVIAMHRIHFMMEIMDVQRRAPLTVRIAHLLVTAIQDHNAAGPQRIDCRQEDLAQMLGVSRVSVGKALKQLQDAGHVVMHYGFIELPDVPGLLTWLKNTFQVTPVQPDPDWQF